MRRTKQEAQITRQSLLNAALTVFSQKGYGSARLEDIADAAGVTRGAVYHHFGGKPELYMALVKDATVQGDQLIQSAIAQGGTFTEIAARIMTDSLRLVVDDPRFGEVMALMLFKTGDSPELGELKRLRFEQARSQVEGIAAFFRSGIQQGLLRADLDPYIAARGFLAYQNGVIMLWLANPQAFSLRESADKFADLYLRGIV
ncbi:MAG: TetR family transcriptional regulator [Anaerolineaceae bacterium]|nr:TetR family transcriptional regulator [Anaerolineaceae bacterium]